MNYLRLLLLAAALLLGPAAHAGPGDDVPCIPPYEGNLALGEACIIPPLHPDYPPNPLMCGYDNFGEPLRYNPTSGCVAPSYHGRCVVCTSLNWTVKTAFNGEQYAECKVSSVSGPAGYVWSSTYTTGLDRRNECSCAWLVYNPASASCNRPEWKCGFQGKNCDYQQPPAVQPN